MLTKRVIACLDVDGGRVVKGVRFEGMREAGDPVERARRYCEQGVDEIVLLDITATRQSRDAALDTVAEVSAAIDIPLTAGGGVRTLDDARLYLAAGADKVAINSAAFADPSLIGRCAAQFGSQCVVVSIDVLWVRTRHEVATHGGSLQHARDALEWGREAQARGAGEVLLTSIDRDGTRSGFDLPLIASFANALRLPLVASGGAHDASSFADAFLAGADAALGASIFHTGDCSIAGVKQHCALQGLEMRR
jgi:imidazole glycerol-phosphate synthase subunit HisF